jgi:hypothetical protein
MFAGAAAFKVTFTQPLAPTITALDYNLVSAPRFDSVSQA